MSLRVCMFVYNNFTHDARVLKEAQTLQAAGYAVTVIALRDDHTQPCEDLDGIRVVRVEKDPLHLRLLARLRHVAAAAGRQRNRPAPNRSAQASKKLDRSSLRRSVLHALRRAWVRYGRHLSAWGRHVSDRGIHCLARLVKGGLYDGLKRGLMRFHLPLCFWDYYLRSLRYVDQHPADIYHAHDLNTLPVAYWAGRRHRAKVVYDSHELYLERNTLRPPGRIQKAVLSRCEAFLIRRAAGVITVNESIAKELERRYGVATPTVVMNTPRRISVQEHWSKADSPLRAAAGVPPGNPLLIYSGSITFNRGLEKLIESLIYLPDCYLVLMGYGAAQYKERLQRLAVETGAGPRFSFFGPVAADQVTLYAADADLGVAPIENVCLSYYYCSPNKVFEYLLAGLPVIASDFPELRKVIITHDIGCTFDPADPRSIAQAARTVLGDQQTWDRMRANTATAALSYNWENESQKLLNLYQKMG